MHGLTRDTAVKPECITVHVMTMLVLNVKTLYRCCFSEGFMLLENKKPLFLL